MGFWKLFGKLGEIVDENKLLKYYSPIIQKTMEDLNATIITSDFFHPIRYRKWGTQIDPGILFVHQNRYCCIRYKKEYSHFDAAWPSYCSTTVMIDFNRKVTKYLYIEKRRQKENDSGHIINNFQDYFDIKKKKENMVNILFDQNARKDIMDVVVFLKNKYSYDPAFSLFFDPLNKNEIELLNIGNNRNKFFLTFNTWIDDPNFLVKIITTSVSAFERIEKNFNLLI